MSNLGFLFKEPCTRWCEIQWRVNVLIWIYNGNCLTLVWIISIWISFNQRSAGIFQWIWLFLMLDCKHFPTFPFWSICKQVAASGRLSMYLFGLIFKLDWSFKASFQIMLWKSILCAEACFRALRHYGWWHLTGGSRLTFDPWPRSAVAWKRGGIVTSSLFILISTAKNQKVINTKLPSRDDGANRIHTSSCAPRARDCLAFFFFFALLFSSSSSLRCLIFATVPILEYSKCFCTAQLKYLSKAFSV